MTRRNWFKALLLGGPLLGLAGGVALVRSGGYALDPAVGARLSTLEPWQYILVRAVARRMVAPDRPDDPGVPTADDAGVAEFVDGYVGRMRPALRRDLLRLLRYTEQIAPLLGAGLFGRFTALAAADQDRVLAALETSGIDQLRAGFQAMKSLVMMGYYRDPRIFPVIGYPGPLLAQPARRAP